MQVSEIMHKGIVSVNVNESVRKVAQLMKQEDIGAIPVLDKDKPVGFVTDRDIVISCVAEGYNLDEPISHAMSDEIVSVTEDQDIKEASRLMSEKQISRILVVDKAQKPVGIVSLKDLTQEDEDISEETLTNIKQ